MALRGNKLTKFVWPVEYTAGRNSCLRQYVGGEMSPRRPWRQFCQGYVFIGGPYLVPVTLLEGIKRYWYHS